jgi:hypothetical protein
MSTDTRITLEPAPRPGRRRLPNRRALIRQRAVILDPTFGRTVFYTDFGFYRGGVLGELWLEAHKQGTFARGILDAMGRMISFTLQLGAEEEEVIHALSGLHFPFSGPVEGVAHVTSCTSVADLVAQEIRVLRLPPPPEPEPAPPPPEKVAGMTSWSPDWRAKPPNCYPSEVHPVDPAFVETITRGMAGV